MVAALAASASAETATASAFIEVSCRMYGGRLELLVGNDKVVGKKLNCRPITVHAPILRACQGQAREFGTT